jgi:hypothetical protein
MWTELTPDRLLSRLSEAEHRALDSAAAAFDQESPLADIAAEVAAEWRGALARVSLLDTRPLAVPSEVMIHILADFRYRAFTRLPGMSRLLDDLRREEWRRANTVRDALSKIEIAPPAAPYAPDPETAGGRASPSFGTPANLLDDPYATTEDDA